MTTLKAARYRIRAAESAPASAGFTARTAAPVAPAPPPPVETPAPAANVTPMRLRARAAEAPPEPAPASPSEPRPAAAAAAPPQQDDDMPFAVHDDGFGDQIFETARGKDAPAPQPGMRRTSEPAAKASVRRDAASREAAAKPAALSVEDRLEAIRKEGLTGRQLRIARRIAQSHNLPATSDHDAVRLLRDAGIDPFQRGSMLDGVTGDDEAPAGSAPQPAAASRALTPLPGDGVKLPQTVKPAQLPSTEQRAEVNHAAEILKMQQEIAKRRRRKLALLFARMFVFVFLPTLVAGWYFTSVATRLYTADSEFVIQQAGPPQAAGLGGLFQGTALATSQDSIAVQGYLQSRDAMIRLDGDQGFARYFAAEGIDPILRLPEGATQDDAYRLYKRFVQISYDPSEGIMRLNVSAPDADLAVAWSKQLIAYAEEQVDQLTHRLRADSMQGARESYEGAEKAMVAAQQRVVELQEKYKILSSDVEVTLLTQQIGQLETQLTQERLSLAQMEANESPNQARMEPVKRRIATLEVQIAELRKNLTEGQDGNNSLARIQGELLVAQADVQTRQMILAQALQAMENARVEANRQVRYLSLSVSPLPPEEPSYPRVFENTLVTLLILLGIYLMVSMTLSILREQVSA
ncbi:MAG: capsule biosynthesis protein [Rhodobacteraceae bacterium]|jgi:capsular polysaccharide transport system permease protein|nr:capsule biosynthesis protein [Paracoccaceae bacterium]